ncbi:hypothetical protein FBEOM_13353 [Fusarium beomiforme]|uniref:Uncharacterized protein n=1 Tax=Fusarium beomiforme TaxID=44412 RepID=A0A9P5DRP1_9HYPO|nr:hypothetical protein FBEOM_13353 [Fusarium beomiforme]
MGDVRYAVIAEAATTTDDPTSSLNTYDDLPPRPSLYSHSTLLKNPSSSYQSREPSISSRPSLPLTPYSDSMNLLDKDLTDDHLSQTGPLSYGHTPESSYSTRPPSVNEEAMRYQRKKHRRFKNSEEMFAPRDRYRRSQQGRHSRYAHHSCRRQQQRNERRDNADTRCLRHIKHLEDPTDVVLEPQPDKNKAVGEKSTKKNKNIGTTWRRIGQGFGFGKSPKKEKPKEKSQVEIESQLRRKSKWKFWTKQELGNAAEANDDSKVPNPNNKREAKEIAYPEPCMLELGEEVPISSHLHQVVRRVSQSKAD